MLPIFHRVPAAVLRPQTVQDIVAMVRYANQRKLKVAIRGDGHSRYGQTQAEAGMVIDSRSLNSVRVSAPESADAQLGAFWSAVADATLPKGLMPPVFPGTCLGAIPQDHYSVERQARFRTVPVNEFVDSVTI